MLLLNIAKPSSEQLRQNIIVKHYFLEVDMTHLIDYDEQLADDLKQKPKVLVPIVSLFPC